MNGLENLGAQYTKARWVGSSELIPHGTIGFVSRRLNIAPDEPAYSFSGEDLEHNAYCNANDVEVVWVPTAHTDLTSMLAEALSALLEHGAHSHQPAAFARYALAKYRLEESPEPARAEYQRYAQAWPLSEALGGRR